MPAHLSIEDENKVRIPRIGSIHFGCKPQLMAFSTSLAARIGTRAATLCQQSASEERVRCPITATPAPQLRGRSASSKDPRVALGAASFRQVFGATHTRARHVVMAATAGGDAEPLAVMVNSCAGKMGHATAVSVVQAGLTLIPFSLNATDGADDVEGTEVALVGKERHTEVLQDMKAKYPNLVIVDFTLPHVVTENCEFYAKQGVISCLLITHERLISRLSPWRQATKHTNPRFQHRKV